MPIPDLTFSFLCLNIDSTDYRTPPPKTIVIFTFVDSYIKAKTHTNIYIYIYIIIEEKERERERDRDGLGGW